MTQKAFLTGASGFIGGRLAAVLLDGGWEVAVLVHSSPFARQEACRTVQGDITDAAALREGMAGVDTVFHLASALGGSIVGREEFFRINSAGTAAVLRAAAEAGVRRVIHFSSAGVLGRVRENAPAGENHPLRPRDAYDRSKLAGEQAALEGWADDRKESSRIDPNEKESDGRMERDELTEAGGKPAAGGSGPAPEVIVIRPGWVYGPGDRRTLKLFKAAARRRLALVGRGLTLQTPVFIDDLVQGTLLAAEKGRPGEIYNLAGPEALTVREIIEEIARVCGVPAPRLRLPLFPTRVLAWKLGALFRIFGREAPLTPGRLAFFIHPKPLDSSKARRDLGYDPATEFKSGAALTAAWYRDHHWL